MTEQELKDFQERIDTLNPSHFIIMDKLNRIENMIVALTIKKEKND